MQQIKNIVFDFGCVLVDLDKHRCIHALNAIGAAPISVYVDECRQEDLFHDLETGTSTVSQFCAEVRRKSPGCKATDADICAAWGALLTGIPARRIEALLRLRRHYRLFLLSNTNEIHWQKAVADFFPYQGHQVEDYFERIYLSYRMHLVKPDARIFTTMLGDAKIEADETLFIDDSPANCAAARQQGIHAMHSPTGDYWIDRI